MSILTGITLVLLAGMTKRPNGAIVWSGASRIDGKPIVAIVTGLTKASANEKTGNMAQVFILRSDVSPLDAIKSGADFSICGDCKHRGIIEEIENDITRNVGRTCYVTVVQAPTSVYKGFTRGIYGRPELSDLALQLQGRAVRLGAYGDPAAVPAEVWRELLTHAKSHTGYTHQWRKAADLQPFVMASVDTIGEYVEAQTAGWRTFRIRDSRDTLTPSEIACPASEEMNYRTTCERCGLCAGAERQAKSIAIIVHGSGARNFVSLQSLRRTA